MEALQIQRIAYIEIIRHNKLYINDLRNNEVFDNLKYEFQNFFKNVIYYNIVIINLYQNKFIKNIDVTLVIN